MRSVVIAHTALTHFVFHPFTSLRKDSFGVRLRKASEKLGITFIKMGQALSMRYDLLPRSDCEDLQKLLDKAQPIPYEVIRDILQREYKGPYGRVFKEFERKPLGSASVSQVHKAVLHDGRVVAVKIKRPFVDRYVKRDIALLKALTMCVYPFSRKARGFRVLDVVSYFESWIHQDVDFKNEAKNIKELYAIHSKEKGDDAIVCMNIIEEFCTDNVLVMDYIDGVPLTRHTELSTNSLYDVEKSIRSYVKGATRSWFREDADEYVFQADPHLSNILALPNGRVANIDCGLVCRLSKSEAEVFKKLLIAIYLKDAKTIASIAAEWVSIDPDNCYKKIEKDLKLYFNKIDNEGINFWFFELTKIFIKHRIKYPLYLITLGRANTLIDGLVTTYLPKYTLIDLLGEELKQQAVKRFSKELEGPHFLRLVNNVFSKIKNSVEDTESILTFMSDFSKALQGKYT